MLQPHDSVQRKLERGSRVRWQIELIWKLWKQYGKVDCWRSEKGMRILCEVEASLMAMITARIGSPLPGVGASPTAA